MIRSITFKLNPDDSQRSFIEKLFEYEKRLQNFIILKIKTHIEWFNKNTVFGEISKEMAELYTRENELKQAIKQAKELDMEKTFYSEFEDEVKSIEKRLKEISKARYEFVRNSEFSFVRFKFESRRVRICLERDGMTPVSDSGFVLLKSGIDGQLFYKSKYKSEWYIPVEDSLERKTKCCFVTLVECHKRALLIEDTDELSFVDKMWKNHVIPTEYVTDKNGKLVVYESGRPKSVKCLLSYELLPLTDVGSKNYIYSFMLPFGNERVYSLNMSQEVFSRKLDKIIRRSQKTGLTYNQMGLNYNILKTTVGNSVSASFRNFPKTREHRFAESVDIISGGKANNSIEILQRDNGKFSLMIKADSKETVCIPIVSCPRNKSLRGTERDYDMTVLSYIAGRCDNAIAIVRNNESLYVKVSYENGSIPEKVYGENAMPHFLGTGRVGIDPNATQICVYSRDSKIVKYFSWETVDNGSYMERYKKLDERRKELQTMMVASRVGCNPDAFTKDGQFKRGYHKKLVCSKHYNDMKRELSNNCAKIKNIKKKFAICVANEIVSMGNEFFCEIPMGEKNKKNSKEVIRNKNGKYKSNHKNARSIQTYSIGGVIDVVCDFVRKMGGVWHWVDTLSGATKYSCFGESQKIELSDRFVEYGGVTVGRDSKSSMNLAYAFEWVDVTQKEKKYNDCCIRITKFDDVSLKNDFRAFVDADKKERKRMVELNVMDPTIVGYD